MIFFKLRCALIKWLAGIDIGVIINCKVYDYVLEANRELDDYVLYERNEVVELEKALQEEVANRINLHRQGISKQGNAFVLKEIR